MKTNWKFKMLSLLFSVTAGMAAYSQTVQAQVPGDDFSLEGALNLFKQSSSPEEFERMLNSADSKVNNLDLNGDGQIDYIRVIDRNEGNIHDFVLQDLISETETQDVAVIELEKRGDGSASLQIIGDADVYGSETIIEPTTEVRVNAGTSTARTVVNVWAWPSVQYVYGPYYSVWDSPWGWSYYPVWWHPWRPVTYYEYYSWARPYRSYYSVSYTYGSPYAHRYYRPYRTTSVYVYERHHNEIAHYRSSHPDYDHNNYGRRDSGRSSGGYQHHDADGRSSNGSHWSGSDHRSSGVSSPESGHRQGDRGTYNPRSGKRSDNTSANRSTPNYSSAPHVTDRKPVTRQSSTEGNRSSTPGVNHSSTQGNRTSRSPSHTDAGSSGGNSHSSKQSSGNSGGQQNSGHGRGRK